MRARFAFLLLSLGWVLLIGLLWVIFPSVSGRSLFALAALLNMLSFKISGMEEWAKVGWLKMIAVGGVSALTVYVMAPLLSQQFGDLPQTLKEWVRTGRL
jgi:uncharacterized membrane protein YeiB